MVTRNLIAKTALTAILGLTSCSDASREQVDYKPKEPVVIDYFASFSMQNSGLALTSGDFDNDGDLDLILGAKQLLWTPRYGDTGSLYFFENDGAGNFTKRTYEVIDSNEK